MDQAAGRVFQVACRAHDRKPANVLPRYLGLLALLAEVIAGAWRTPPPFPGLAVRGMLWFLEATRGSRGMLRAGRFVEGRVS